MNVSSWSIRNPTPSVLLFLLLTLVGLIAFGRMKIQNFPDIDLPTVVVTAALPGAAPAQLETEVARRLENSIATLQGVKHIHTRIADGVAMLTTEFRLEKSSQEAVDDVRDAVARVRSELPADLRDPVIAKLNLAGSPILAYTVASSRRDDEQLSWFVDHELTRALLAVRGVGAVSRVGGGAREVRVELDPVRLLASSASAADISRQLRQMQQEATGGRSDVGGAVQSVRTLASVASADELARLEITLADGRRVRLDQLASVSDTVAEPKSAARLDGRPVVAFEVQRALSAGDVEVAQLVRVVLEELRARHPDVVVTEAFNFVDPVQENYDGSMLLLYEGALLAVLVVWLFLRDARATFVAAVALPMSAIPAFAVLHFLFGFSLNVVVLLSLSLVVGVLVDDAIVEIENITRHLRMGKTPLAAATEAADEIGLAVIATTFTLIAVFLPTAFMAGVAGRFFVQFGWTAAVAVFFSLVVARMLTPMMSAYLLRPLGLGQPGPSPLGPGQPGPSPRGVSSKVAEPHLLELRHPERDRGEPRWLAPYLRWASWCLRYRWWTLAATAAFFAGSIVAAQWLPTGFIPPDDLSQTQVEVRLPPGSTLAQTVEAAEQARLIVAKHAQVKLVYTAVGGGATGSDPFAIGQVAEPTRGTLTIALTPRQERPGLSKQQIETELRSALEALPGARVKVGFAGSAEKYMLVLSGDDGATLERHARIVERELRGITGIGAVTSSSSLLRPELVVRPDFARAADLGVNSQAIADTLRVATAGDYDQALAKLNLAERQVPVVVRLPAAARGDLALLERLPVPGARGPVPLGNVARIGLESGPAQIDRYDRRRNISFEIELNQQPLGEVERAALALPSLVDLPPGISRTAIGDAEMMNELFASFGLAMGTGVLCIYIVLVLLLRSFIQPVTILGALVLSVPGALLALIVTHTALSMPAMIGLIMLMGIATKNSILLVDYVVLAREDHGLPRFEAVVDACRKRARPIVMTTVAMAAGMLPTALGMGTDPSFRAPMAYVVIGGLITSTFLSLLVIPVLYTIVDDLIAAGLRLARRPGVTARAG